MLKLVIQGCERARIPQAVCVSSEGKRRWQRGNPLGLVAFQYIHEQAAFIEPMKQHPSRLALLATAWRPIRSAVFLRSQLFDDVELNAVSQGIVIHRLALAVFDFHDDAEQRIAVIRSLGQRTGRGR